MRAHSITRVGIIFLLLLAFFQQIGAGLFIHNLAHEKDLAGQTPLKQNEGSQEINYSCSCVDNFLMPVVEADEPPVLQKFNAYTEPVDLYTEQLHFVSLIFSSLRGPPVLIG